MPFQGARQERQVLLEMRFGVGSRNDIGGWRRSVGDDGKIDLTQSRCLTLSRCEFKLGAYRRWVEGLVLPW